MAAGARCSALGPPGDLLSRASDALDGVRRVGEDDDAWSVHARRTKQPERPQPSASLPELDEGEGRVDEEDEDQGPEECGVDAADHVVGLALR